MYHTYLETTTGLPKDVNINTTASLLNYLETNAESYEIDSYNLKKRESHGVDLHKNNKIKSTKPRYLNNEDIIYAKFKAGKTFSYTEDVTIKFGNIRQNKKFNFVNGEDYYALGYPGMTHYTIDDTARNIELIDIHELSPLIITTSKAIQNSTQKNPLLRWVK